MRGRRGFWQFERARGANRTVVVMGMSVGMAQKSAPTQLRRLYPGRVSETHCVALKPEQAAGQTCCREQSTKGKPMMEPYLLWWWRARGWTVGQSSLPLSRLLGYVEGFDAIMMEFGDTSTESKVTGMTRREKWTHQCTR